VRSGTTRKDFNQGQDSGRISPEGKEDQRRTCASMMGFPSRPVSTSWIALVEMVSPRGTGPVAGWEEGKTSSGAV